MEHRRTLDRAAALQAARSAAAALAADPRIRLVFLFGSSVDPSRRFVNDIDLAISSRPPLALGERLTLQADLTMACGAPIDLVSLDEAGVVLAHEVADTGQCLFARDAEVELDFVTRARSRYWDFKPYLDEQWKLIGERLKQRRDGVAS